MMNIKTLSKTYIVFNNIDELNNILKVFKTFGFQYRNGSFDDAIDKAESSVINKIICHNDFVMTSKNKVTTISYKVFMSLSNSFTNKDVLLNDNKNNTMGNGASKLNSLRAAKVFKNEKALEKIVAKADAIEGVLDNFCGAINKCEEKAGRVSELLNAYETAVEVEDIKEIERLGKLIDSSLDYITEGNKVLSALNKAGAGVVKQDSKEDKESGEEFIGE